jgi:hypothetical protein
MVQNGTTTPPRRRSPISSLAILAPLVFIVQFLFVHWVCFPEDFNNNLKGGYNKLPISSTSPSGKTTTALTSRSRRQGSLQVSGQTPGAYFNNIPIYLQSPSSIKHSSIHCVGNTPYEETSWMYRSCQYSYLCLDPQTNDFFVFDDSVPKPLQVQKQSARRHERGMISTDLYQRNIYSARNYTVPAVALGGINPRWNGTSFNQGWDKVRWAPNIRRQLPPFYYVLDDNVVMVPFHSFAGHNVGHLLWDDFLPIFTVLQTFDLLEEFQPLLLRVDTLPTLYASCDIRRNKRQGCQENFDKFLPLMGVDPKTFSTVQEIQLKDGKGQALPSSQRNAWPICAKHAIAGLGMLTDHGWKDHGWEPLPTDGVHNVGRGPQLYQFRNFMLRNLGLAVLPPPQTSQSQFHILLNAHSSRDRERDMDMEEQRKALSVAFPLVKLSRVKLKEFSLQEQLELVSQRTNIFVSTCGGGSMSAYFLPRGSSLILYYPDQSGFSFDRFALTGGPAILDWDLFNNAGYLRVHWLPISSMNSHLGLEELVYLIKQEMDVALSVVL